MRFSLVNDARLLLNHARDFAQSAQSLGNTAARSGRNQ